ncbi:MAG: peroxide stress protein YaaA [Flavobacteriia bacterium]|nr:peroxide stress protein YaaA [Flavobacteriia bacterium]
MKIVISPAKSIDYKPLLDNPMLSFPCFLKETEVLVSKLRKISSKNLSEMMHISTDLADLNYERYQNWEIPNEVKQSNFPCIAGFNGEAYKGFDAWSLSQEELIKAQDKLRILSGLYGLLKPLDLIYPYRLEMGTKWQITAKIKNLYQYWGIKLAHQLNREMLNDEVLVNLASIEYFKAIDLKVFRGRIITPVFKDFKNGEFKTIMMYAKHQRGAMARFIIQNNIANSEELKLYNRNGYTFDVNSSTENDWVFIR